MTEKVINQNDAWYRNPMVWFVIALPTAVVLACIFTIRIAITNAPQLIDSSSTSQHVRVEYDLPS